MDIKHLKLRLDTFRREYFDISSQWIKNSWSWLWHFSIDNFKFLYLGEINQIQYLNNIIVQQKEYIKSNDTNADFQKNNHNKNFTQDHSLPEWLLVLAFRLTIIPFSFLIYWIRRSYRIIFCKKHHLNISDSFPTEDLWADKEYNGNQPYVYLSSNSFNYLPRGLLLFNYTIDVDDNLFEPILYIDPGPGFSSEYSIPLPYSQGQKKHSLLMEMPPCSKVLKLQVSSSNIEFFIKDTYFTELNFFTAAWYLNKNFNYGINDILHALFIKKLPGVRRIQNFKATYPSWHQAFMKLESSDITAIKYHQKLFTNTPKFSLIIQVNNHNYIYLKQCLKSLESQLYECWELLIMCSEQPDAHTVAIINDYERNDDRIKIVISKESANISNVTSDALNQSTGEYLVFIESHDVLTKNALYHFVFRLQSKPDSQLIYSDYDHIDKYGKLSDPRFKPNWDYDLFFGKNYIQYLVCYKSDFVKTLKLTDDFDPFSNSGELNSRYIEQIDHAKILHISQILLHHRLDGDDISPNDGARLFQASKTIQTHLDRTQHNATVSSLNGIPWVKWPVPEPQPLLSLIVLTRDRVGLLTNCITGLLEGTDYKNIEIIIVDNGSVESSTLGYLEAITQKSNVKVIREPSEFNFSRLNNLAVKHAKGEYIGLINNDISVIDPGWLHEMMGHLLRDEVGIVGPKLLYENNTIQHAGVILGLGGVAGHAFRHQPHHSRGYDDRLVLCQQLSCVTAACLLTKKSIYNEVGGLNETSLKVAFNDVDYCLKVRELGYKLIWTPFATLYHLESASRSSDLSKENIGRWNSEYSYMVGKWKETLEMDPYYNPNLTISDEDFSYSIPPRLHHPWERYLQSKC